LDFYKNRPIWSLLMKLILILIFTFKNLIKKFLQGSSTLKLIDLSNSNLLTIDASLWSSTTMPKLTHLYLNNLPSSIASSLFAYLVRDGNFERLETLHIRNIGAHSKSLDLLQLITMANVTQTLNMRSLDISHNAYDYDLNEAFFGQHKLQRLESLCAANNSFRTCSSKRMEKMFLTQLQCLDLSRNKLSGAECFKAINQMTNLEMLHASHNELRFEANSDDLGESLLLLSNKPNMSSVDLSHNNLTYFVSYFKLSHAPTTMNKLDLSFNQLSLFRFLSLTQVNKTQFASEVLKSVKDAVEDAGEIKLVILIFINT